jgi:hypothetical protein
MSAVVDAEFGRDLVMFAHFKISNPDVSVYLDTSRAEFCAIEKIVSNGQRVNYETMDTAMWAGYFGGAWQSKGCDRIGRLYLIPRPKVRWAIGRQKKVTDATIRKVITERFGRLALKADEWAALAVGLVLFDNYQLQEFRTKYRHAI